MHAQITKVTIRPHNFCSWSVTSEFLTQLYVLKRMHILNLELPLSRIMELLKPCGAGMLFPTLKIPLNLMTEISWFLTKGKEISNEMPLVLPLQPPPPPPNS